MTASSHGDGGRHLAIGRDVVKGGDKLAMSQVTGRAEDHDRARLWDGAGGKAFAEGIWLLLVGHGFGYLMQIAAGGNSGKTCATLGL